MDQKKIIWSKIDSPSDDFCQGYQAKGLNWLWIERVHIDDREYDGGRVATYWNLWINGEPVEQYNDLASARQSAERTAQRVEHEDAELERHAEELGIDLSGVRAEWETS